MEVESSNLVSITISISIIAMVLIGIIIASDVTSY